MGADMKEDNTEYEILLSDCSASGQSPSEGHAWSLLKAVMCANLVLLVISASVLTYGAFMSGETDDQSFLSRAYGFNRYFDKGLWLVRGYGSETNNVEWACLCEVVHSQFSSLHLKLSEISLLHTNVHGIANYLGELVSAYRVSANTLKQLSIRDGSATSKNLQMPSSTTHVSGMTPAFSKRVRRSSRSFQKARTASFTKIMKDLSREGLLQSQQRVLCLDSSADKEAQALKKKGFINVEHIDVLHTFKASNQMAKNPSVEALTDETFDFVFTTVFDHTTEPALFVAEIERILKVGGLAAMHVSLNAWHNKYIRTKPGDSSEPVTVLFKMSKIVYVAAAHAPGLDTVIVFRKSNYVETAGHMLKMGPSQHSQESREEAVTVLSEEEAGFHRSMMNLECRKCIKQ